MSFHFMNGLKCTSHLHGASCAIDVLLEVFYFCLYKTDHVIRSKAISGPLTEKLLQVCNLRNLHGGVNCQTREPLWDLLVQMLPSHFAPKGRGNAETQAGFAMLMRELPENFQFAIDANVHCLVCDKIGDAPAPYAGMLTIESTSYDKGNNVLQKAIEVQLEVMVGNSTRTICPICQCQQQLRNPYVTMPKYLLVDCVCFNHKNPRDIVIHELLQIFGNCYQLLGAVMVQPGHFFAITINEQQGGYMIVDDMKSKAVPFPTFSAAVKNNTKTLSRVHTTSKDDHGVFLLLLKHIGGSQKLPYQIIPANSSRRRSMAKILAHDASAAWSAHVTRGPPAHYSISLSTSVPASCTSVPTSVSRFTLPSTLASVPASGRMVPQSTSITVPVITSLPPQSTLPPPPLTGRLIPQSTLPPLPVTVRLPPQSTLPPAPQTERMVPQSTSTTVPVITSLPPQSTLPPPPLTGRLIPQSTLPPLPVTVRLPSQSTLPPAPPMGGMMPLSTSATVPVIASLPPQSTLPPPPLTGRPIPQSTLPPLPVTVRLPPQATLPPAPLTGGLMPLSTSATVPVIASLPAQSTLPPSPLTGRPIPHSTLSPLPVTARLPPPPILLPAPATVGLTPSPKPSLTTSPTSQSTLPPTPMKGRLMPQSTLAPAPASGGLMPQSTSATVPVIASLPPQSTLPPLPVAVRLPPPPTLPPALTTVGLTPSSKPTTSARLGPELTLTPSTSLSCLDGYVKSPSGKWTVKSSPSTRKKSTASKTRASPSGIWIVDKITEMPSMEQLTLKANSGKILVNGEHVGLVINDNGMILLNCKDLWKVAGLKSVIGERGYPPVDKILKREGFKKETAFSFSSGNRRVFVRLDAAIAILKNWKGRGTWKRLNEDKMKAAREILTSLLPHQTLAKADIRKRLSFGSQSSNSNKELQKTKYKFKYPVAILRKSLVEIYHKRFKGNRTLMMKSLSGLFRAKHMKSFTGFLSTVDLKLMLSPVPSGKKGTKNMLEEIAIDTLRSNLRMTPEDLINLVENYTGYGLARQLRRKLPCIPSERLHTATQKKYSREFSAVLLPRRTPTGYEINISRLVEVLKLKYHWLRPPINWKIYGDGRKIGGKQSTFVAISPMNNEAMLHGMRFQSSKNMYPVNMFYESDSRDNLEENLGFPVSRLDGEIRALQEEENAFSLSGDDMFLQALLDGDNRLGPTTETGWSIYKESPKQQKSEVSASGLRTDMGMRIDRQHPSSLLPSIPLESTVFCLLHGQARSVERLLELVLADIAAEANRLEQQIKGVSVDGYRDMKVQTLENNINQRGVRQGKFQFLFDKSGKPEKISLNKDHAYTILIPACDDNNTSFSHCLQNVLSHSNMIENTRPANIKSKLKLQDRYSMYDLVTLIWHHFYEMITILREDPPPELKDGCNMESTNPDDYVWGYKQDGIQRYLLHAESFYQLFTLKYSAEKLTPYMMKFIDQAPQLMKELPFPLSRYQAEGGEHKNYDDNRFYYQHTTRHGGHDKADPLLSTFCNMWKVLSHSITQETSEDQGSKEAAMKFMDLVKKHVAAVKMQQNVRGWLTRNKLNRHQQWTPISQFKMLEEDAKQTRVNQNKQVLSDLCLIQERNEHTVVEKDNLFRNQMFVLCGAVPKMAKMKQADVQNLIEAHGGRVRKGLPSTVKGVSTKKYTVLTDQVYVGASKKVQAHVRLAIQGRHHVLKYEYVLDSIKETKLKHIDAYAHDVSSIAATTTKRVRIDRQHFYRSSGTASSYMKRRRKHLKGKSTHYPIKKNKQKSQSHKVAPTPCLLYALQQTKLQNAHRFSDYSHWISHFTKNWKTLAVEEKQPYIDKWKKQKHPDRTASDNAQV